MFQYFLDLSQNTVQADVKAGEIYQPVPSPGHNPKMWSGGKLVNNQQTGMSELFQRAKRARAESESKPESYDTTNRLGSE